MNLPHTLSDWLLHVTSIHSLEIELGLDRVKKVAEKLKLLHPICPVVTVAGTNGKGSCVAGLAAIYQQAGFRVGTFTSPVLFKHNEQVKIQGKEVEDRVFCQAFSQVEENRGDIALTAFEYHALAALWILSQYALDVWILEVGLGGRLDAVNVVDADLGIVSSIDLDHTEWLGDTRETIAKEKAGIFRPGCPAVCGDADPPLSLLELAENTGSRLYCQGKDFYYQQYEQYWSWQGLGKSYTHLPLCQLATQNMSTVLMAVELLQKKLPVSLENISQTLSTITLAGRIQVVPGVITHIYDVSHNPAAVALLAAYLKKQGHKGKVHAVFSMLKEKDIVASVLNIKEEIDDWYIAELQTKRAASQAMLLAAFQQVGIAAANVFSSIAIAYQQALSHAKPGDCVVIFGSFHTVAGCQPALA